MSCRLAWSWLSAALGMLGALAIALPAAADGPHHHHHGGHAHHAGWVQGHHHHGHFPGWGGTSLFVGTGIGAGGWVGGNWGGGYWGGGYWGGVPSVWTAPVPGGYLAVGSTMGWGGYPLGVAPYPFWGVTMPFVAAPTSELFGPRPVLRLMGSDPDAVLNNAAAPRVVLPVTSARTVLRAPAPQPRATNDAQRRRAESLVATGDESFRQQKVFEAYQRYRRAVQTAPDWADGYFRQGFALVALDRYADAAKAFREGLRLEPRWPQLPPRTRDLYDANGVAKHAHLDRLAQAALAEPHRAELLMLLGIELFADEQLERSGVFFERAAQLDPDDEATRLFLQELARLRQAAADGANL